MGSHKKKLRKIGGWRPAPTKQKTLFFPMKYNSSQNHLIYENVGKKISFSVVNLL